jgi:hypothetical protein
MQPFASRRREGNPGAMSSLAITLLSFAIGLAAVYAVAHFLSRKV